ncbi:TolB-like translocation protein [Streptomyces violascens]|uniref:hypothetical protein n=1 Tax=Streptomyces violascens TaxID=67381 RepID=UPI0036B0E045
MKYRYGKVTQHWLLRGGCAVAVAGLALATVVPVYASPPLSATTRVSVGLNGAQPDGWSVPLGITGSGRYALFASAATNLVPSDTNGQPDVFVRDLWSGHTERVSVADDDAELAGSTVEAAISGSGRYVAFSTDAPDVVPERPTNGAKNIYVRDLRSGHTALITAGHLNEGEKYRNSYSPSLSWDGRYVAFSSNRTDLAPGGKPWTWNVLVTDRLTGVTRMVTTGADGSSANRSSGTPTISADGSTIGFSSAATNLLPSDLRTGKPDGTPLHEHAVPRYDPYYAYDVPTGRIQGASVDAAGALRRMGEFGGSLSPDGRAVAFALPEPGGPPNGSGTHLELYVRELSQATVAQASTGLPGTTTVGSSHQGSLTFDGHWVAFTSDADNLVRDDTGHGRGVFRHDVRTGRTERVSVASDGTPTTGKSGHPFVNAVGTAVLFESEDGTLVPGDNNGFPDVFVRRLPR